MAIIKKGISHDQTYIVIDRGFGYERFLIKDEHNIFLGYGTHVRTPDGHVTIKGNKYALFWADGKNIKIPFFNGREFDGLCVIESDGK